MKARLCSGLRSILAFLCMAMVPFEALAQNYSDIWWNPNESGWGLTLADHNSQLFGVWFTYREDGRPTWYVIPGGTFSNNRQQFRGDIYATTGPAYSSATFDPSRVTARVVGTATIDFAPQGLAAGTALFGYSVGGVTQTKQIQRQPFGNAAPSWGSDVTDIWWNPAESGWGLTMAQHGNNVFAVWFTYDTDSQPLWVVMPGVTFSGASSFTGTLYTTTGPYFGITPFDPSKVVATQQGSASISVTSAASNSNPNCAGANSVTFDPVFRGNTVRRTICAQAFGDPPGEALFNASSFISIPRDFDPKKPGSASPAAIDLLLEDLPEMALFAPNAVLAEQGARSAVLAQVPGGAPVQGASYKEPWLLKSEKANELSFREIGYATALQLHIWRGDQASATAKKFESSKGADVNVEMTMGGGRAADGTVSADASIAIKGTGTDTHTGKSLDANFGLKVEGKACPDATGKVKFKFNTTIAAQGAAGAKRTGSSEEIAVTGTAQVNDAAQVESINYEYRMQKSVQRPDSHNAFVDATFKNAAISGVWDDSADQLKTNSGSGLLTRRGSTTTNEDANKLLLEGRNHVQDIVMGYVELLQYFWRDGQCVELIAPIPGVVAPGSMSTIEAKVRHKIEGTELHVPVESSIAGAVSLTPSRIAASPGTFTYVAPPEEDRVATLKFSTTSRRGMAKAEGSVRTKEDTVYKGFVGTGTVTTDEFTIVTKVIWRIEESTGTLRNYRPSSGDATITIIDVPCTYAPSVGSSRVDLQACKLEYSIVSPK